MCMGEPKPSSVKKFVEQWDLGTPQEKIDLLISRATTWPRLLVCGMEALKDLLLLGLDMHIDVTCK